MGQVIQKGLQRLGVNGKTLKFFFQTTQDKMHQAIQFGDLRTVQYLFKQQHFQFAELSLIGENSLHLAVRYNQFEVVQYIVLSEQETKSNKYHIVEDRNLYGDTPLMVAVMNKNLDIVRFLVDIAGADVNARENSGGTVFIAACVSGQMDIILFLYDQPSINIHAKNNDGQNALHRACYFGEILVVRFLIKTTKLSILTKDKIGNNCFHLAAKKFHFTLIRYLLKKFKRQQAVLQIHNGDNLTTIQILVEIFNEIKEEGQQNVTESQVQQYIYDKNNPPELFPWVHKQKEIYKRTIKGLESTIQKQNKKNEAEINPFGSNKYGKRVTLVGLLDSKQQKIKTSVQQQQFQQSLKATNLQNFQLRHQDS